MSQSLLIELLQYKAWADQELMQCLCENQDKLSTEQLKKSLRMMNHIHVVDCIFAAHLSGKNHPYTSTNTDATPEAETLSWMVQETNQTLLESDREFDASDMHSRINFQFTDGDRGSMTPIEMLLHLGVHSTITAGKSAKCSRMLALRHIANC